MEVYSRELLGTARVLGVDAYRRGLEKTDCPFNPSSPLKKEWLRGWDRAEETLVNSEFSVLSKSAKKIHEEIFE